MTASGPMLNKLPKRDRWHTVHRWLNIEFPCQGGRRPRLRVVKKMPAGCEQCAGVWYPSSRIIYLAEKQSRSEGIYTLLHEHAHAYTGNAGWHDAEEPHGVFFDIMYGRIQRRWLAGGDVESLDC